MMRIALTGFVILTVAALPAAAGPLPWNYYVRFGAPGDAQNILLGTDERKTFDPITGVETSTPVFLIYRTYGFGPTRIHYETQPGTTDLFNFAHGDWEIVEKLPDHTVANGFTLSYGFGNSEAARGSVGGTISADGAFDSGTGNFTIGLSEGRELDVDGRKAHVYFGTRESESQSVITMTITPEPVPTPEPTTLALAGIGIAGLLGFRLRRRRAV